MQVQIEHLAIQAASLHNSVKCPPRMDLRGHRRAFPGGVKSFVDVPARGVVEEQLLECRIG